MSSGAATIRTSCGCSSPLKALSNPGDVICATYTIPGWANANVNVWIGKHWCISVHMANYCNAAQSFGGYTCNSIKTYLSSTLHHVAKSAI